MEKLLHTPEGVRDIYNVECGKKLALENRLKKTLHLFPIFSLFLYICIKLSEQSEETQRTPHRY